MGHGRRSRGGEGAEETSSPEFGVGDANANCPPQILSYLQKGAFCGLQNTPKSVFGMGCAPNPAGGVHDAPQVPYAGEGTTSPYSSTDPPSALAMRPPELRPDLRWDHKIGSTNALIDREPVACRVQKTLYKF